jgi:hypothetical protein
VAALNGCDSNSRMNMDPTERFFATENASASKRGGLLIIPYLSETTKQIIYSLFNFAMGRPSFS